MADIEKELRDRAEWRAANEGPFTKENLVEWRAADELSRLREVERRAVDAIREQAEELLWNAYGYGVQTDDRWWDGGLSDAEWLTRELELPSGWNDIAIVRQMIPGAAKRIAARVLSERKEGQANG